MLTQKFIFFPFTKYSAYQKLFQMKPITAYCIINVEYQFSIMSFRDKTHNSI